MPAIATTSTRWPPPTLPASRQVDICDAAAVRDVLRPMRPDVSCTWRPRAMSTARSTARRFHRDQRARHLRAAGRGARALDGLDGDARAASASTTCPPTRSSARSAPSGFFTETSPTSRTRPIRPPRPGRTTWCAPGTTPTACRRVTRTAPTITGPTTSPKSSSRSMILNALEGKPLPVYGDGANVRDWLYVEDHARALVTIAERGRVGESYNVGGWNERTNLEVVQAICDARRRDAPGRRRPARAHRASSPTGPATTGATRSTPPRSSASSAGRRRRASRPACARRCAGTSTIRAGGGASARAATAASGWAGPRSRARERSAAGLRRGRAGRPRADGPGRPRAASADRLERPDADITVPRRSPPHRRRAPAPRRQLRGLHRRRQGGGGAGPPARVNARAPACWRPPRPRRSARWCTFPPTTCSTARKAGAYREDDPVAPLGVYGATKAEGEARCAPRRRAT